MRDRDSELSFENLEFIIGIRDSFFENLGLSIGIESKSFLNRDRIGISNANLYLCITNLIFFAKVLHSICSK